MGLAWDPSLAVGVKLIDDQHKELYAHVDALLRAMLQGKGKSELEPLLGFLGKYVQEHFGAEEKLMERHAYPEMAEHKKQHVGFIQSFTQAKAQLEKTGPNPGIAIELNDFLSKWLRQHISRTDLALAKHLAAVAPELVGGARPGTAAPQAARR
jgi:hemerythrin